MNNPLRRPCRICIVLPMCNTICNLYVNYFKMIKILLAICLALAAVTILATLLIIIIIPHSPDIAYILCVTYVALIIFCAIGIYIFRRITKVIKVDMYNRFNLDNLNEQGIHYPDIDYF